MARYSDTIRDERTLAPVSGALVFVKSEDGSTPVLTDDSGAVILFSVTDIYGIYSFNTADGRYTILAYYHGRLILRDNIILGAPAARDLAALAEGLPDEADGDTPPSLGSGMPYLSAGVLKFA